MQAICQHLKCRAIYALSAKIGVNITTSRQYNCGKPKENMQTKTPSTTRKNILRSSSANILRTGATLALGMCVIWIGSSSPASASPGYRSQKTGDSTGDAIYKRHCSVCHGDRGNGNSRADRNLVPPPRDFNGAAKLTRETMIDVVTNGKPGTAMMGWKTRFSEKEIASVVDYIRSRFMLVALDPRIALGRGVYGHFCQVCHGDRGQGAMSAKPADTPRDLTSPKNQTGLTRERMITSVSKGKHGSVKAGFAETQSAEHIEAVVDFIRQVMIPGLPGSSSEKQTLPTSGKPAPANPQPVAPAHTSPQPAAPAHTDINQPLPKKLKGNAQLGEKFFMTNCATCHGKQGDGQGPRAYFINPKPRNFLDDYSRTTLSRPTIFFSVTNGRQGTEMPGWGKVLSEQEIANVTEFVFQTFIQPNIGAKAGAK